MKVLVTGGTGVVGSSTVTALLRRGHTVRLLSRHAADDAQGWPEGVEAWPGDVGDAAAIEGAAEGCDAVAHLVAIVSESPPEATFERINVQGTRNVIREAERSAVGRFVYVSSLGADRGSSEYHQSKLKGEQATRAFTGSWAILRPGAVYGPGDEHLSVLLRMIRTLPVVPTIGGGAHQFQPVWHEDVAEAVAIAVERTDLVGAYDLAGDEITTQDELVERMRALTDRTVVQLPIPDFLASWGMKAASAIGLSLPISESQLEMLTEGNVIPADSRNALTEVFGVTPTPLAHGLSRFIDEQPEQLPSEGVGTLQRKRFWAEFHSERFQEPEQLLAYFRTNLGDLMPSLVATRAEPGASTTVALGETLTLSVPLRGHIQVRVAEVDPRRITLLTLEGHPLAGAVRFLSERRGSKLHFEAQVYDRPASIADLVVMRTVGEPLQAQTWTQLVRTVAEVAGAKDVEVQTRAEDLDKDEAERIDEWVQELSLARKRNDVSEELGEAAERGLEG